MVLSSANYIFLISIYSLLLKLVMFPKDTVYSFFLTMWWLWVLLAHRRPLAWV